jgi:hypothetical protein
MENSPVEQVREFLGSEGFDVDIEKRPDGNYLVFGRHVPTDLPVSTVVAGPFVDGGPGSAGTFILPLLHMMNLHALGPEAAEVFGAEPASASWDTDGF